MRILTCAVALALAVGCDFEFKRVGDPDHEAPDTDPPRVDSDVTANEMEAASLLCVQVINAYRATLDIAPLARWTTGEACAAEQAEGDSTLGLHANFGQCGERAQNECPDWHVDLETTTEDCLAMMWAEGPGDDFEAHGHYITMSNTAYTEVACGYFVTEGGTVWAVQNFR